MRIRIEKINLIGANRHFEFKPGLNVIVGSIATGKTTLLRCLRGLLGASLKDFSLEAKQTITNLAGHILIGDEYFDVVRPFNTTRTALVDIAGKKEKHRLPASERLPNSPFTYGNWLLQTLGLPILEVPSAPTQFDSNSTPVTINDYLMYCSLQQGEIDNTVFGHTDPFKNIKRKYVFDILYGKYSIEVAQLRDRLREIIQDLRRYQDQTKIFQEFLEDTPFENQAEIEKEVREIAVSLEEIEAQTKLGAEEAIEISGSMAVRESLRSTNEGIADIEQKLTAEINSREQLTRLISQLQVQSKRLTRSIVADELLVDFDYLICPRCGAAVEDNDELDANKCYLCKNEMPHNQISKEDLIKEQDRLERQIDETRQLIALHEKTTTRLQTLLGSEEQKQDRLRKELDFITKSYVSEQASQITEYARRRAELSERYRILSEILQLFSRFNDAQKHIARLQAEKQSVEAEIDAAIGVSTKFEEQVAFLEEQFRMILDLFKRPHYQNPGMTGIDRKTYLPVLDGRRFDELQSQGLNVMVNVAHVLAHQLTGFKFHTKLPNILFIDGLTGNMGYEGLDQERIELIYEELIELSKTHEENLQIIVVDNSVPAIAKQYIRAEFTEENKLIPLKRL